MCKFTGQQATVFIKSHANQPRTIQEVMVDMWCAMNATAIIWAINSNQSATDILTSFLEHLSDYDFFRKTVHNLTPQTIKCIVYSVFGEQILSRGLWPPLARSGPVQIFTCETC